MFGFDSLLGLPLHLLIVHFAVVLVPLAAIAFIALGWQRVSRERYSLQLAAFAVVGAGCAFLAAQSGGSLKKTIRARALSAGTSANFGDYPGNGKRAEILAIVLEVGPVASWLLYSQGHRVSLPGWTSNAVYWATSLVGVFAILAVVIAGHSGSALVWRDVGNYVSAR
jgi:uncharacterized membrane protein